MSSRLLQPLDSCTYNYQPNPANGHDMPSISQSSFKFHSFSLPSRRGRDDLKPKNIEQLQTTRLVSSSPDLIRVCIQARTPSLVPSDRSPAAAPRPFRLPVARHILPDVDTSYIGALHILLTLSAQKSSTLAL